MPSFPRAVRSAFSFRAALAALFFGALVVLCFFLYPLMAPEAEIWRVRVTRVVDGDSLVLATGERLRLRGIGAPDLKHREHPEQYYGMEAKKILAHSVAGRELFLDRGELGTDRHGRLIGVARLTDGRMLNLLMVEEGAAFAYPHAEDRDSGLASILLEAQREAMRQGKGFWPRILSMPSASGGYVGSRSSLRFHSASCAEAAKISRANRIVFSSLRQAFDAGYAPAKECTSWPVVQ